MITKKAGSVQKTVNSNYSCRLLSAKDFFVKYSL